MARTREIKKRMTAVGTIQRITKTMQMIATAKFTNAMARAKASRPYTQKVDQLVAQVLAAAGDVENPLIDGPAKKQNRELLLVITSDRGLCGAFNGTVLRAAMRHIRKLRSAQNEVELHTSGKKAVGFFKFQRLPILQRMTIGDKPKYEDVQQLAERYIAEFAEGKYDAIRVAYMRFVSNSRQVAEVMQLLPLKPPPAASPARPDAEAKTQAGAHAAPEAHAKAVYEFSPGSAELLAELLPLRVKTALFQAFNDAVVSEQIMRMVAMKAATDNARGLGKTLKRSYNRARQAQITTELMEVISGAAALE